MKSCFFFIFLITTFNLLGQNIEKHQWKNRVILIFSDDIDSNELNEQINILSKEKKGLTERKLILYRFINNKFSSNFNSKWNPIKELSKKYHSKNNNFEIILIGLDGGIKLRQTKLLSLEKLFTIIDGMPMRRRELKSNTN